MTSSPLSGQIIFKNLPQNELFKQDSVFFDIGKTREIISLHGKWKVFPANSDKIEKVNVEIPSTFIGELDLVFQKSFVLSAKEISNHQLRLHFLGLNYSADIFLNDVSIYRHTGGEFPFALDLPKDILYYDKSNVLSVKLSNQSDSKNTIPVKQKFHFPQNSAGIFRDVYIHLIPNVFVSNVSSEFKHDAKSKKHFLYVKAKIENRESVSSLHDTLGLSGSFSFYLNLSLQNGETVYRSGEIKFQLNKNKEIFLTQTIELASPILWSPSNPKNHVLTAEIYRGESLIDKSRRSISLCYLKINDNGLDLNNQRFNISGVTYFPIMENYGGLISYSQMEKDIRLIKETGFNSIRFAKKIPHPYCLALCQKYGLLTFIELPISGIPSSILAKEDFKNRTINYINFFSKGFGSLLAGAVGIGSSFSGSSEDDIIFIQEIANILKKNTGLITYASFKDNSPAAIKSLDLLGVEIINSPLNAGNLDARLINQNMEPGRTFFSEATYLVSRGSSDGYLNDNSFEAQAKYFEDVIEYSNKNSMLGYFLNSMYDYRSEYASIISGYNEEQVLRLGLADENRNTDRMSYKVIFAKLNNAEKVTIPIGSKKDDSPMLFIITGILIAIIMGVMINSGKKFREDSSRALLRPYNFFADVRDQRLISGVHTFVMVLIIALTSGLLLSNILFYLKENIRFERMLLSFGSSDLLQNISFLAWNPLASIWWFSLLTVLFLFVLIIIIKAASFFVKTRVALGSVFHAVIWSFLPLVILVPVGIVLYRVLTVNAINIYLFIGMFVFTVWIFYRLMKAIYVIYDTNPGNIYLYSILIIFIAALIFIVYFELKESVFTYLLHSLKGYNILG